MSSFLFPSQPFDRTHVDFAFTDEVASVVDEAALIELESLHTSRALVFPTRLQSPVLYRGWMLTPPQYHRLAEVLQARDVELLVAPDAYVRAHHMDGWLAAFDGLTPDTVLVDANAPDADVLAAATALAAPDGYFVKDLVKSQKHAIAASYAPTAAALPDVVAALRELQGADLADRLAIRRFVPLDSTTPELRTWYCNGVLATITLHPDFADHTSAQPTPPLELLDEVAARVAKLDHPFVAVDVAKSAEGGWLVVEVGDGQVSGLPDRLNAVAYRDFYQLIADRLRLAV